jgi:hypothetical protein
MDGVFISQPDLQVPQKEVGQHACENVMMPAHELSNFVMVHAQFGFGFLKALLNRPAQAAEPHQGIEPYRRGGVGKKKCSRDSLR